MWEKLSGPGQGTSTASKTTNGPRVSRLGDSVHNKKDDKGHQPSGGRRPGQIPERHDLTEDSTRQGNLETACWGLRSHHETLYWWWNYDAKLILNNKPSPSVGILTTSCWLCGTNRTSQGCLFVARASARNSSCTLPTDARFVRSNAASVVWRLTLIHGMCVLLVMHGRNFSASCSCNRKAWIMIDIYLLFRKLFIFFIISYTNWPIVGDASIILRLAIYLTSIPSICFYLCIYIHFVHVYQIKKRYRNQITGKYDSMPTFSLICSLASFL